MPNHPVSRIAHTNPDEDRAFRDAVEREMSGGPLTAVELERRLRGRYPNIRARRRELAGERESLYVYREGRWVRR